jgi:hypothetical protein
VVVLACNERCPICILLNVTTREVLLEEFMDTRGKANQMHGKGFWKEAKGRIEWRMDMTDWA